MKKNLKSVVFTLFALAVFYGVLLAWMIYISPLTCTEMDFNHNGLVDFSEADYASSFGERKVIKNGRECLEYFAYKDGLPLKINCVDSKSR